MKRLIAGALVLIAAGPTLAEQSVNPQALQRLRGEVESDQEREREQARMLTGAGAAPGVEISVNAMRDRAAAQLRQVRSGFQCQSVRPRNVDTIVLVCGDNNAPIAALTHKEVNYTEVKDSAVFLGPDGP